MTLGEYVKLKRLEKGFSRKKLSQLTGLSASGIEQLESNRRPNPRTDTISKLAKILDFRDLHEETGISVPEMWLHSSENKEKTDRVSFREPYPSIEEIFPEDGANIEALIKAINHEDSNVRNKAAFVMGERGAKKVVYPLTLALKDISCDVRKTAVEALGKINSSETIKPLMEALHDEDGMVRKKAIKVLMRKGKPAIEALLYMLNSEDYTLQYNAAEALGKIGDRKAVEYLIEALNGRRYIIVRLNAIEALGKIGDKRAVEPLINLLQDKERAVRKYAAQALGNLKAKEGVEPLVLLLKERDVQVNSTITESLGKIGEPAKEILSSYLQKGDRYFRENIAFALNCIDEKKMICSEEKEDSGEIQNALGNLMQEVKEIKKKLDEKEFLFPGAVRVEKSSPQEIPLISKEICPASASEKKLQIPAEWDVDFAFISLEQSMEQYRIFDGDTLYVKRQSECNINDTCVILVHSEKESRLTVKKCKEFNGGKVYLDGRGNLFRAGENTEVVGIVKRIVGEPG